MDARRATDLLCRTYASLSLSTTAARIAAPSRTSITRSTALNVGKCQSCRHLSSTPTVRKPQGDSQEPSYNHDMYKRRDSGFLPTRKTTDSTTTTRIGQKPRATKSSVEELFEARVHNKTWGQPTQKSPLPIPSTTSRYTHQTMDFPSDPNGKDTSLASASPAPRPRVLTELDIHVKPRTGRTLFVDSRRANDLGAKLRALDTLISRNKIKTDFYRQRFHERPGLKRKRLNMQRWRANFGTRFRNVVSRVNYLRVQGW